MLLTGEYYNKIDDKGRLMVPAKIRTALASEQVVVTKGLDDSCISLYSPEAFERQVKSIMDPEGGLGMFDKQSRAFTRRFIAPSQTIDFDSTGRINIPQSLREYASVSPKSEVVILGMGTYVEIWNRSVYEGLDEDMNLSDLAEALISKKRGL